jgi:hypothetical protein
MLNSVLESNVMTDAAEDEKDRLIEFNICQKDFASLSRYIQIQFDLKKLCNGESP